MKKHIALLFVSLLAILGLLSAFNPKSAPLMIHMVVFILLYTVAGLVIEMIIMLVNPKLSNKHRLFAASIMAFCPILIIALQTVGNLSILDIVIVIGLPSIIVWYGIGSDKVN